MVKKETCPVCKGNKVVTVDKRPGSKDWQPCHVCNGAGYQVRVIHIVGMPTRY